MPDAHKAPAVAKSVNPAMKIAVSNRVISQLLRMAAPQSLNCVGLALGREVMEKALFGRLRDDCGSALCRCTNSCAN
jgi:hypothetical protein